MDHREFTKEDYEESCSCTSSRQTVPIDRVLGKLDSFFAADDYNGAERHILYWLEEARNLSDLHGQLLLLNECIGLYRKCGNRDKALVYSEDAIILAKKMGMDDSVTMGTTYINAATAYSAFGETDKALSLYAKAKKLYEKLLPTDDGRLGGLYNNMALAVMNSGDTKTARELFEKALSVMNIIEGGEPSMAITYCNLADLAAKEFGDVNGEREIGQLLEKAFELLEHASDRRDGEYAYACEKCAPTFAYYGYFIYESVLNKRARSIYEGH